MSLSGFLYAVIIGLGIGSIYALIALGYTMVYGIIRLINFAHGDFLMVGGYTMFYLMPVFVSIRLPVWLTVIGAVVSCAAVGVLVELIAYRPVRKRGTGMSALITAIGMSLLLENLAQVFFSATSKNFGRSFFPAGGVGMGAIVIPYTTLITVGVSAVLMAGLVILVQKTRLGRAMRAVSEDKEAAIVSGVNVNQTILCTFAIGAALAAFAAVAYCNNQGLVNPTLGANPGLKAFVAAVLGGIGSLPGAMIGGLMIGVLESVAKVIPGVSNYVDALVYVVLILVLLVKPSGLLGKKESEKV